MVSFSCVFMAFVFGFSIFSTSQKIHSWLRPLPVKTAEAEADPPVGTPGGGFYGWEAEV